MPVGSTIQEKRLSKSPTHALLVPEDISRQILLARKQRIMLDADLAGLYGASTNALEQTVKCNMPRFHADFMFRLDATDVAELYRLKFVTGSQKHRDPCYPPHIQIWQQKAQMWE